MFKYKLLQYVVLFSAIGWCGNLFCQDTFRSKITFGVRFNTGYDFQVKHGDKLKIIRLAPVFSVNFKNHNFYIGPQYSYIFQPTPVSNYIYEHNAYGLNFGYRYNSGYFVDNLRVFGQFNYSLFWVNYMSYQHGSPYSNSITTFYVKNDASVGLDYRVVKKLHISLGFGIGSYHAFFLVLDNFTFISFIGIEYDF